MVKERQAGKQKRESDYHPSEVKGVSVKKDRFRALKKALQCFSGTDNTGNEQRHGSQLEKEKSNNGESYILL